ncbi:TLD domain-containing protein [Salix suchowensis]|nr:TLD domain-containing protein [Salix suchowensis]
MGNSQSPPADPRFSSATRAFTQKDLEDLNSLFVSLAAQSKSNNEYVSLSVFQAYFGLKGSLGERLFDLVTQQRKDNKLTFHDLVIAKSVYEKGTRDDIEDCNFWNIFSLEASNPGLNTHPEIINEFLNAAIFSKAVEGADEKSMSFEDFRSWCALLPSVRKFLGRRLGSQVPQLMHGDNINPDLILLREEYAWHIGGALPHHELEEWKLLYHSAINGMSFNTFLGSTLNGEGPTILIIKDKDGYIYGGYASQPWERHGNFYGDLKSFLFSFTRRHQFSSPPEQTIMYNGYCAANFSSESIPNGIGFGGRVNHFGLFLSASFDVGQTFTCTTFGSPCLSKTSRIFPEVIECWGIIQNGAQKEKLDAIKGTVLDRFKEERHMLNMVGLANSSE